MPRKASVESVRKRTEEAILRSGQGKDPRLVWRGRPGIWVPGQLELPPLIDIRTPRISEEIYGQRLYSMCLAQKYGRNPELARILHVANGGNRSAREGASFKAQGVRPGVPDYFLPVVRAPFHGMWLELKALDGDMSKEQRAELEQLSRDGYACAVAWGDDAALSALTQYLSIG